MLRISSIAARIIHCERTSLLILPFGRSGEATSCASRDLRAVGVSGLVAATLLAATGTGRLVGVGMQEAEADAILLATMDTGFAVVVSTADARLLLCTETTTGEVLAAVEGEAEGRILAFRSTDVVETGFESVMPDCRRVTIEGLAGGLDAFEETTGSLSLAFNGGRTPTIRPCASKTLVNVQARTCQHNSTNLTRRSFFCQHGLLLPFHDFDRFWCLRRCK
jgi:hypothetical protein